MSPIQTRNQPAKGKRYDQCAQKPRQLCFKFEKTGICPTFLGNVGAWGVLLSNLNQLVFTYCPAQKYDIIHVMCKIVNRTPQGHQSFLCIAFSFNIAFIFPQQ